MKKRQTCSEKALHKSLAVEFAQGVSEFLEQS